MTKLSVTLSHIALGAIAIICFAQYSAYSSKTLTAFHGIYRLEKSTFGYFYVTLITLLLYAIFGVIASGASPRTTCYQLYQDLYTYCSYALFSIALPCCSTELWLTHGFGSKDIGYGFLVVGLLATVIYFTQSCIGQEVVDFLVVLNMGTLIAFGVALPSINIITAWVFFLTAYGFFRFQGQEDAEVEGLSNYCLAVFTYFIHKSVTV